MEQNFVAQSLGIQVPHNDEGHANLSDFMDLALRYNPRRAHLLASKVIPRCHVLDPELLECASAILACLIHDDVLGVDFPSQRKEMFNEFHRLVAGDTSPRMMPGREALPGNPIVVGFASSGIGLGMCTARHLGVSFVHSVHQKHPGSIQFREPHSLKPNHYLTQDAHAMLAGASPVILVDDEITTGNTMMNTILSINELYPTKRWVVASLVDSRNQDDVDAMERFADRNGFDISVVALASGNVIVPDGALEVAQRICGERPAPEYLEFRQGTLVEELVVESDLKDSSHGLTFSDMSEYRMTSARVASAVIEQGCDLVVSLDEYNHVPHFVSSCISGSRCAIINKTPLYAHDGNYPIQSSTPVLIYRHGACSTQYLYNMEKFEHALVTLPPDMTFDHAKVPGSIVDALSHYVNRITLVKIVHEEGESL